MRGKGDKLGKPIPKGALACAMKGCLADLEGKPQPALRKRPRRVWGLFLDGEGPRTLLNARVTA